MKHPARTAGRAARPGDAARRIAASTAPGRSFVDVLDQPATASPLAAQRVLQASAVAGKRLVAAGARGHIVYSDDRGATWQQAKVPVSADLTALHFVDARQGWAVGHEGVVLHTARWRRDLASPARRPPRQCARARARAQPARRHRSGRARVAEGRGRARSGGRPEPAVPRRLVRQRARRLRRRRLQPDLPHRATAARPGSPGSSARRTNASTTCMASAAAATACTWSANWDWRCAWIPRPAASTRCRRRTKAATSAC